MGKPRGITLLALALLLPLQGACLRYVPDYSPAARYLLVAAVTTASVTPGEPPRLEPPRQSTFSPTDSDVFCAVRLTGLQGARTLRWRWYAPDGGVYLESDPLAVAPGSKPRRDGLFWHRIGLAGEKAATLPGTWRVAILLDDHLIGSASFELRPPE